MHLPLRLLGALACAVVVTVQASEKTDDLTSTLERTSSTGGMALITTAEGLDTALQLASTGRWVSLVLVEDESKAADARTKIRDAGQDGMVTVVPWLTSPKLPLSDNMANLVIDFSGAVDPTELQRVTVPVRGETLQKSAGTWTTSKKPMPTTMDGWTHFFYDGTGNKVSRDTAVDVPNSLRWIGGPRLQDFNGANGWRIHDGIAASEWNYPLKTSKGSDRFVVEGRDAFNGVLLWQEVDPVEFGGVIVEKTKPFILDDGMLLRLVDDGSEARIAAVDPLTGTKARTYQSSFNLRAGSKESDLPQFNYHDGVIVQAKDLQLRAIDAKTDALLWEYTHTDGDFLCRPIFAPDLGLILAMEAGRNARFDLFKGRYPSADCKAIVAIDARTGKLRWRAPLDPKMADLSLVHPDSKWDDRKWTTNGGKIHALSYQNGRVFALNANDANGGKPAAVWAVNAQDGSTAWVNICGPSGQDVSMFDMYLLPDGTLFTYGHTWARMDQQTGELLGYGSMGGNARCDTGAATTRIVPAGFGNYFDISSAEEVKWTKTDIARGQCGGWGTPAYGMVFYHGSGCGCFFPIRGNMAVHRTSPPEPLPDAVRLIKGPAYEAPLGPQPTGDWPEYLQNGMRSAWSAQPGPRQLDELWKVSLATPLTTSTTGVRKDWLNTGIYNGPLTAPVIAGGLAVVADRDGRRVIGLDARTGKELWTTPVDGRILTSPSLVRGRVVFGTRNGSVYCLDARNGQLAWRFFAAPTQRFINAYGQVESAWPLHGALPVVNDTVIASAGYHGESDGGVWAWGLDLATGNIKWARQLVRPERGWTAAPTRVGVKDFVDTEHELSVPNKSNGRYNPTFVRNIDLPMSDGDVAVIGRTSLDPATGELVPEFNRGISYDGERFPFLDMSFEDRGGPHGTGTWNVNLPGIAVAGRDGAERIAHSEDTAWLIRKTPDKKSLGIFEVTGAAKKDSHGRIDLKSLKPLAIAGKASWAESVDSFIVAGGVAYVASERGVAQGEKTRPRMLKGEVSGGKIEAFDLASGKTLGLIALDSAVINNGLAVAEGRLYASCEDGTLRCFGAN